MMPTEIAAAAAGEMVVWKAASKVGAAGKGEGGGVGEW
jgi:hypothetical protein